MTDRSEWTEAILRHVQQDLQEQAVTPEATYRLQFHPEHLPFRQAAEIVPYLQKLGITHLYASPYLASHSASPHGYAIVDYGRLDPRLGDAEDYRALVDAARQHDLKQILDIVPNHMAVAPGENAWWTNILENGPSSPYAPFFDIEWWPVKEELRNRILLPMLGDQFGQVLESGQLQLHFDRGAFFVRYYEHTLPLDPRTYAVPLNEVLAELKESLAPESEYVLELESILTALDYLPDRLTTVGDRIEERQREKEIIKHRLEHLAERCPEMATVVQRVVERFNGQPGEPSSFDRLEELLDAQVYRLAHWKAASDEINYRRFFDINELAALSTELPPVFEATHQLVFQLLAEGRISGLRVDHIDGLFDPLEYLWRLQGGYLRALARRAYQRLLDQQSAAPTNPPGPAEDAASELPSWEQLEPELVPRLSEWTHDYALEAVDASPGAAPAARPERPAPPAHPGVKRIPLYVVVEKILGPDEPLPTEWPVAGTTGYDFLNPVTGLFVDPRGWKELGKLYQRFTQEKADFNQVVGETKRLILRVAMASDLQLLARRLNRISEQQRFSRDFTLNSLRHALREILSLFPVYRTYAHAQGVTERDRRIIRHAVNLAKRTNPAMDAAVFDFVAGVLLFELPATLDEAIEFRREQFVGRFQQVTSPVTAKGIEDTAFYRYYRLTSRNEVGGDPAHPPTTLNEFHEQNLARHTHWPHALLCTSTHDNKRSEDVRARIHVLSEIPRTWRDAVNRWTRLNRRFHRTVDGQIAPSRNDEYLFYQTLVGIWPIEPPGEQAHQTLVERLLGYLEKATHEAKRHTSWISPDPEYDEAVRQFVLQVLSPQRKNPFLASFQAFHQHVLPWGLYTALSQCFLKLVSPGVPDIYQGQELWDFSLVDPDNRRPVDYALRRQLLDELHAAVASGNAALQQLARQLSRQPQDPRLKLLVTWQTLQFRRRHPELFSGQYVPLHAVGAQASHVCAWLWRPRTATAPTAICIAPRLLAGLTPRSENADTLPVPTGPDVWSDTHLNLDQPLTSPLKNHFTGQPCPLQGTQLHLADALADFPLALLSTEPDRH